MKTYPKASTSPTPPPAEPLTPGAPSWGYADPDRPPPPPKPRIMQQGEVQIRDFPIPITGGREALVQVPSDLSTEDLGYVKAFFETYEKVIVTDPAPEN